MDFLRKRNYFEVFKRDPLIVKLKKDLTELTSSMYALTTCLYIINLAYEKENFNGDFIVREMQKEIEIQTKKKTSFIGADIKFDIILDLPSPPPPLPKKRIVLSSPGLPGFKNFFEKLRNVWKK